jgi:NTE family protein
MKVGIALGGGGAKGCAHIGVLRALDAAHIQIDLIAGTSAGAIAGALYAAGKSPDEIERAIRRLTLRQLLTRDRTGTGLFSTDGIHRLIENEIGKATRIEDLPRGFVAVAVEMDSGEEIAFDRGLVADAVCASAAFPGLFAPVRIDGRCFLDGGVTNPVPFDVARRLGADRVLAVDLGADEPMFTVTLAHRRGGELFYRLLCAAENQAVVRVASRAIGIMTKQMRLQKMRQSPPDAIIYPDVQGIGLMDFDLAAACIAAGEQAAYAALPRIDRVVREPDWRYRSRQWIARIRREFVGHSA